MTLAQLNFDQSWAGSVPARWRWSRNKEFLAESLTVSLDGTEELLSVSHLTGITPKSEKNVTMTAAENLEGYRLVCPGDLVINTMWAWMGALGVAKQAGIVSPAYGVYSPRASAPFEPRFYGYVYRSEPYVMEMTRLSRGIWSSRLRLYPDVFLSMAIPVPPLEEQRAIADYLDRETAHIDTLIDEQQRLIEMLRERRQAVVEHSVGHGLGAEMPTRPSGLFWTDEVPDHWPIANIRKVATMKTGHTPSRSNPEYWVDCTIPWFTLADVWQLRDGRRTYLGETASLISEVGLANSAAELLPAGTVVLSRTASVGFSGIMPVAMATSQDFWNWIPGDRITAEYLMWTFRAMRSEIQSLMIGSTHKTIYQPTAAAFRVPVPPVDEQERIVAYLDDQTHRIDTIITESERLIELSKERRAALITAAVTGQIDVWEQV